jgi:catechol 2,3-dioxygenase-like lactoylglutathione lyase family enzyme
MKFGYTIIYVQDVAASLAFFKDAFDMPIKFIHGAEYGELDTGSTTLAFASHSMGERNLPGGYFAADSSAVPLGVEIALVADDVAAAHDKAVATGATSLSPPNAKPWGQIVAYVRCPDGTLVELCSAMA